MGVAPDNTRRSFQPQQSCSILDGPYRGAAVPPISRCPQGLLQRQAATPKSAGSNTWNVWLRAGPRPSRTCKAIYQVCLDLGRHLGEPLLGRWQNTPYPLDTPSSCACSFIAAEAGLYIGMPLLRQMRRRARRRSHATRRSAS